MNRPPQQRLLCTNVNSPRVKTSHLKGFYIVQGMWAEISKIPAPSPSASISWIIKVWGPYCTVASPQHLTPLAPLNPPCPVTLTPAHSATHSHNAVFGRVQIYKYVSTSGPLHMIFLKILLALRTPIHVAQSIFFKRGLCSNLISWETFPVVQWLRLCTSMQREQFPSLVGKLRSHMAQVYQKKKKKVSSHH